MIALKKTPLQIANDQELKKLKNDYELFRKIITAEGFTQEWYKLIPKYKNATTAFHALNQFYYNNVIPPNYRYSSYNAFLVTLKRKKNEM